jgi:lipopolysaccharide export LptBFGC system permease protein LptF
MSERASKRVRQKRSYHRTTGAAVIVLCAVGIVFVKLFSILLVALGIYPVSQAIDSLVYHIIHLILVLLAVGCGQMLFAHLMYGEPS